MVCPRCDGNGIVNKILIQDLNREVYWCDECDALWESYHEIAYPGNFVHLMTYVESNGLKYDRNLKIITLEENLPEKNK